MRAHERHEDERGMMNLADIPETSCSCDTCKKMCDRPCWPTPEEVEELVKKGFGKRLMLDWWQRCFSDDIMLVSPALIGFEQRMAPSLHPIGGCTFQNSDGLCELHQIGLKPIEGRLASCKRQNNGYDLHKAVSELWDSDKGREVVKLWKMEANLV